MSGLYAAAAVAVNSVCGVCHGGRQTAWGDTNGGDMRNETSDACSVAFLLDCANTYAGWPTIRNTIRPGRGSCLCLTHNCPCRLEANKYRVVGNGAWCPRHAAAVGPR
jgi:hypothetical protein